MFVYVPLEIFLIAVISYIFNYFRLLECKRLENITRNIKLYMLKCAWKEMDFFDDSIRSY